MSKRLFTFLLVGAFVVAGLAPMANAACVASTADQIAVKGGTGSDPNLPTGFQTAVNGGTALIAAPTLGAGAIPTLNNEGLAERLADIVVYDDGNAPNCFQANQTIRLTYNTTITVPNLTATPFTNAGTANFDVYDSAGQAGLVIGAASTVGLAPGGTPQTVITVTVLQAGTVGNPTTTVTGSAFRIKNLYADATTLTATSPNATVTVSNTIPGALINVNGAVPPATVGTASPTIAAGAGVTAAGSGTQSKAGTLDIAATFSFAENFANAFRVPRAAAASVLNDIATTATSLVFDAGTSIPSGVTVSFPSSIIVSNGAAAGGNVKFTLRSASGTCTGPANCFVIYDTAENNGTGPFSLTVDTAAASSPGTYDSTHALSVHPKVGVVISSPSGFGTATLHAFFGPGAAAGSTNDDVSATAVPRYVANNGTTGLSRNIFSSSDWFTINAVRTTLLYPFASTFGGFNTGISIANTCNDAGVFGATATCTQTGGIKFYFFPTGGTPFTLNTDTTAGGTALPNCRGLNASGQLAPGGVFACGLDTLVAAAGGTGTFDGYVIAVTSFNNAHGFSAQFNGAGAPFAANNALVLGAGARVGGTPEGLNQ